MATRQTGGKSGKRGTATAGRKPGTGTTSRAKPARGSSSGSGQKPAGGARKPAGATAKGGSATASANGKPARSAAPASSPASRRFGSVAGWWQGLLRWSGGGVAFWTMVVSVLGLVDSVYLTYEHFTESGTFACPENPTINCVKVTTSPESHVFGIPVAVLGLAFFLFMVVVNSRWGWRAPWAAVHWARLGSVVVGIVFVLYLIWAELFRINAICLFCTAVHIFTFILFALIIGRAAFSGVRPVSEND
jgi:uncharacterized membrane protein